jgi:hypothetical protein
MENLTLGLPIPLISYPQAGGKLRMGFSIAYSTPILVPNGNQQCNIAGTCFPIDVSYRILNPGISVVPHFVPQVVPNYCQPTGAEEPELQDYSVTDPGGANHHLGQTGTNTLKPGLRVMLLIMQSTLEDTLAKLSRKRRRSATPPRAGRPSRAMSRTASLRSTTTPPNARCASSPGDARISLLRIERGRGTRRRHLLAARISQAQRSRSGTLSPSSSHFMNHAQAPTHL